MESFRWNIYNLLKTLVRLVHICRRELLIAIYFFFDLATCNVTAAAVRASSVLYLLH